MKPRFVIVMLLVLALAVPASMLAQQSKAEKEIRGVIDELNQANLKSGAEAALVFDKYYANEYQRIFSNGAVYTKAAVLDGYRLERPRLSRPSGRTSRYRFIETQRLQRGSGAPKGRCSAQRRPTSFAGLVFS